MADSDLVAEARAALGRQLAASRRAAGRNLDGTDGSAGTDRSPISASLRFGRGKLLRDDLDAALGDLGRGGHTVAIVLGAVKDTE